MSNVTVTFTCEENEAWEFAQLLKRLQFNTVMQHVPERGDLEAMKSVAYTMIAGCRACQQGLADAGIAPR